MSRQDEGPVLTGVMRVERLRAPRIQWAPAIEDMPIPQLRFLRDYWSGLAGPDRMVDPRRIDAMDMKAALGHIIILDVIEGGVDFRYRVYGSSIARRSGYDLTGKCLSGHPTTPAVRLLLWASYSAVLARRAPLYCVHEASHGEPVAEWHRLILPLGERGEVSRLLVGNVASAQVRN